MATLKRWLFEPQTTVDDLAGGVIVGLAVVFIFRFAFDDSWAFAVVAGVVVALVSAAFTAWRRRRARFR